MKHGQKYCWDVLKIVGGLTVILSSLNYTFKYWTHWFICSEIGQLFNSVSLMIPKGCFRSCDILLWNLVRCEYLLTWTWNGMFYVSTNNLLSYFSFRQYPPALLFARWISAGFICKCVYACAGLSSNHSIPRIQDIQADWLWLGCAGCRWPLSL